MSASDRELAARIAMLEEERAELEQRRRLLEGRPEPADPALQQADATMRLGIENRLKEVDTELAEAKQVREAQEGIDLVGAIGTPSAVTPTGTGGSSGAGKEVQEAAKRSGCSPGLFVAAAAVVVIALVLGFIALGGDDGDDEVASNDCATESLGAGQPPVQLISHTQSCPEGDDEEGGGSDGATKPTEDELPAGAILFEGTSGDQIGCITCDGQSRFLSLTAPGVAVGNAEMGRMITPWELDGQVLEFGARLTAPNLGRYGVNLFIDGEYGPGVALEVGEQSAVYQWTPERDGTLRAGTNIVIIVGEGGTVDEDGVPIPQGDYALEWWFVFQPD